jgi:hypothetical protein
MLPITQVLQSPHTLAPGEKGTGLRPRESEERASHEKTTCGAFVVRACVGLVGF